MLCNYCEIFNKTAGFKEKKEVNILNCAFYYQNMNQDEAKFFICERLSPNKYILERIFLNKIK
jgi:hypothetical protein